MKPTNPINLFEPQVMAIVNVTDDSFYDASRTITIGSLHSRICDAVEQGATIIDIGGYSSRSGANDISLQEEWLRVRRGLEAVRDVSKDVVISVDTFRAEVAQRAIAEFGWMIINDISAGELSPEIIDVVAEADVPYVAMHMRGTPQSMQHNTHYDGGVVAEVYSYFEQRVKYLSMRGVKHIIIDPGFGFAKSVEQNYELLASLNKFRDWGCPILAGLSRKSMIYKVLDSTPADALAGTIALNWEALRQGATILRVHDVREAVQQVKLYNTIKGL